MACAEALEEEVRGMRICEGTTSAPHRPGQDQQRAGEHPDAMQALSRLLAHHGKTYWQDGRWEDATPRVDHGVAARVDRLKAIGNGQVPQCAAEAWRRLGRRMMNTPNAAVNVTPVSVADQLDEPAGHVSRSSSLMHEAAIYLRRAGPVICAARSCVLNSAWAGVSDEDVALEQALRDGGWL